MNRRMLRTNLTARSRSRRRGVGMVEVLVVIAILGVLLAILLPVLAKVRQSSRLIQCTSNLRRIGASLQTYALESGGRLPDPGISDKSWEQMVHPYYGGGFACPSDHELFPAIGSSYDWRDTGRATTTLAGRVLSDVRRLDAILAFESLPGWHAKGMINVCRLDGSVQNIPSEACFRDLEMPIRDGAEPKILAK